MLSGKMDEPSLITLEYSKGEETIHPLLGKV